MSSGHITHSLVGGVYKSIKYFSIVLIKYMYTAVIFCLHNSSSFIITQPAGNNAGTAEMIRLRTQYIKSISDSNQKCWTVVCRSLDNHPDVRDTVLKDPLMLLNKRSALSIQ